MLRVASCEMREGPRANRDDQFEIFTAGKREILGIFAAPNCRVARRGCNGNRFHYSTAAACSAEAREVGGKPIGAVDHRVDVAARGEKAALRDTRLRPAQSRKACFFTRESRARRAERSRNGKHVARPSAGARLQVRWPHFADDGYGDCDRLAAGEVAAGDCDSVLPGTSGDAAINLEDLGLGAIRRYTERDGSEHRFGAHCSEIAQVCCHRAPAGIFERHQLACEVHAFDEHVGRDHAAMRTRGLPYGGVVADAEQDSVSPFETLGATQRLYRGNNFVFGHASRERIWRSAAAGSGAPKTVAPITSAPAPASTRARAFPSPTPPSTSIKQLGLQTSIKARASRTFLMACGMNFWPENPGLTLITSTVSQSSMTSCSIPTGVWGQIAIPAFAPIDRRCTSRRCACGVASKWKVIRSHPAARKSST